MPADSPASAARVEALHDAGNVVGLESNARGRLALLTSSEAGLHLSAAAPGRPFGPAVPIRRSKPFPETYNEGYALSISPLGDTAAAWVAWDRTLSRIDEFGDVICCDQIRSAVVSSRARGSTGRPVSAGGNGADEGDPMAAALPRGGHVVAWSGDGGAQYTLVDRLGRWTARRSIARDARKLVDVGVMEDGTVAFTYAVTAEDSDKVAMRSVLRLTNGRLTMPRTVISNRVLDNCCTLGVDDSLVSAFHGAGNETAALVERPGLRRMLVATNRTLRGSFGKPQLVDTSRSPEDDIRVEDLEINERGAGLLLWELDTVNDDHTLRYAIRSRGGRFGPSTTLVHLASRSARTVAWVDAAVGARRFVIAYALSGPGRPEEVYVRSGTLEGKLGSPRLISREPSFSGTFAALDGRDRLAVAWTDKRGTKVLRGDA